ncbi:EAL domain-containing protein [Octadecabacter sp. G9-8]|uniref:EAL domain-containing protein n=1 Tax=Octadecabacter dasysiphoniae TaxID=2909341 RepID=A0ABS9CYF6_9RHOB|nr:EAL domain-containing protein [Octadecabacter dasysiphoniae]MCF2872087.1 EAL domain-containing protein [Octadecabacter dasysiphoniae]
MPFDIAYRLDEAVWIFDIDSARILKANDAACRLWQADTEKELCARNLGQDMSVTVGKRLKQYQTDFLNSDAKFTELWTLFPNGEPHSVMVTYRGFALADGRMAMQCEAVSDIGDTPENLRSAEALLHTDVLITLFSKDGPPLYLNPASRNAYAGGLDHFENLFVDPVECRKFMSQIDIVGEHRAVTKLKTSNGVRWFDLSVKTCSDAATGEPAILMTAIDVSELKEARDTARHLADRDQLTGLHNRAYLQNHLLRPDADRSARSALIFFDVDRFKLINDRYGHEAGDTVLQAIAKRASGTFRASDLVARLGGDEFVVLVESFVDEVDLEARIGRLRASISDPIVHDKTRIDVAVSVGVAVFSPGSSDLSEVLREADIALYASKKAGRDQVTFFTDEMGTAAKARDLLEIELARGIENDEFVLHYQPRIDVASGQVVGAEGLVRWMHPTRGLILPSDFIAVCEETGLIEDLGRKVLEQGCEQAIKWHRAGLELDVSLNVSPRQFSDPALLETLFRLANLPDFPLGHIELEVTENVLIGDPDAIAEKLKAITAMGYNIAIDDFGTGYSNLAYILRFPLTCIKIDRSFISQLPSSGPLVQLIISLGEQTGAMVVSEGVETHKQLDWLRKHDCAQAQGHVIAPPLQVAKFESFLAKGR